MLGTDQSARPDVDDRRVPVTRERATRGAASPTIDPASADAAQVCQLAQWCIGTCFAAPLVVVDELIELVGRRRQPAARHHPF
jgi:hypothetical protein